MLFTCKCGFSRPMHAGQFPLHCRCGQTYDAPPEAELPGERVTLEQLTSPCPDCDHYRINEVCDLWPKPNRCQARRRWVHAVAFGRFICPLGLWPARPDH